MQHLRALFTERQHQGRRYLLSPFWDFMLAGGAALLFLLPIPFLVEVSAEGKANPDLTYQFSMVFAMLAYAVNNPHFAASYQILYGNLKERFALHHPKQFMWWRLLTASVLVPLVMIAYFAYAHHLQSMQLLGYAMSAMFFFVGWHYCKQAYGVFMALSGMKGIIYNHRECRILRIHVYLVWAMSWLSSLPRNLEQIAPLAGEYGVLYQRPPIFVPEMVLALLGMVTLLYGVLSLGVVLNRWRISGKRPSMSALAGFGSMHILLLWSYYHPLWVYAAPMFHSLQYLLFVYAYKRGEAVLEVQKAEMEAQTSVQAQRFKKGIWFVTLALILGAAGFQWAPAGIEAGSQAMGMAIPAFFMFSVFINIHHYFIDNVIWRKENPEVNRYFAA